MLRDFPARGPDSTRNTAAVPSDRSVAGPPGGGRAPRREVARPSGRIVSVSAQSLCTREVARPSGRGRGVARPKPGGRACGIPSPPSADGAKRLREAAPARKPPPASGGRAPCGGARSGCPGPASRGRP